MQIPRGNMLKLLFTRFWKKGTVPSFLVMTAGKKHGTKASKCFPGSQITDYSGCAYRTNFRQDGMSVIITAGIVKIPAASATVFPDCTVFTP